MTVGVEIIWQIGSDASMSKLFLTIFNCLLMYAGWYGAIILASQDYPLLAALILVPIILWEIGSSSEPMKRGLFALLFIVIGFFIETTVISLGVVSYISPVSFVSGGAPLWVLGLWGIIGATFDDILQWIKGDHPYKLALAGLIGAPLASYSGSLIGAVSYPKGIIIGLAVSAIIWAVLLPIMAKVRKYF